MEALAPIDQEKMTPKIFIELMNQFYELRWMLGSSGGMACCEKDLVYYSPSSVQKERLTEDDLFVFNAESSTLVHRPKNVQIKETACTPVFNVILNETEAQCVIHTHSKYSNLLTQLVNDSRFEISDQEMIKGVLNFKTGKNYANFEHLVVPIIENTPQEFQLVPALTETLQCFPESCGVLVRNHGFFVWGPTWQKTKIMLECYEYLFELACEMHNYGIAFIKSHSI